MKRFTSLLFFSLCTLMLFAAKPAQAQPVLQRYPAGPAAIPFTATLGIPSLPKIVQIENTGAIFSTLTITAVAVSTADFTILSQTCTAHPLAKVIADNSATCIVMLSYNPLDATGPDNVNLNITSNTGGVVGTVTPIALAGTPNATAALTLVPNLTTFGNQKLATTSGARIVEVRNTGTVPVTNLTTAALAGTNPGDFAISQNGCTGQNLNPGASCLIQATFTPTALAARSATFSVGGTSVPAVVAVVETLNGNGVQPAIAPIAALAFGSVQVGATSATQTVTVTNSSASAALNIGNITHTNATDYILSGDTCSNSTIAASASCSFNVAFKPSATGALNDTISIPNDSATNPVVVNASGTGVVSSINNLTGALVFADVPVGVLSTAQTVTLENSAASGQLVLGNLQQIGANPENFVISNDACSGATLAPAATCSFDVAFISDSTAAASDTILVPNNSTTPAFTVAVSGTAVVPVIDPDTTAVAFGSVPINTTTAPTTVTVTNNNSFADLHLDALVKVGADTTRFAIVNDNCSNATVAPNATCTFGVTFSPNSTVAASDSVLVSATDPETPSVSVGLSGTGEESVATSNSPIAFGNVAINTSATQTVTITNTSATVDLHINGMAQIGADTDVFKISNDNCSAQTIAAGGANTCTFDVVFKPDAEASFSDTILVSNDSSTPILLVAVSGSGVGATVTDSGDVSFGQLQVGATSAAQTVTITNTSADADLHIGTLSKIGADPANFTISNDNCSGVTVAAGGTNTCTFDVKFHPTSVTTFSDTVLIPNDSTLDPLLTVALDGEGIVSSISSNGPIAFGNVPVGQASAAQTVTITNTSASADLTISGLTQVGANTSVFAINNDNCSGVTVAAGGANTCTFDVVFSPDAEASFASSILVANNSDTPNFQVALAGAGVLPDIAAAPTTLSFGNVAVNTTSTAQTVTVTNADADADLHIGTLALVGANPGSFAISNDTCSNQTVAFAGGTCTFDVSFSPASAALLVATVQIPNDSATPVATVGLDGTGVAGGLVTSGSGAFGNVNVGNQGGPNLITVTNSSTDASVAIGSIVRVGANTNQFSIRNDNCSNTVVAPSGNCTFQAVFNPTAGGAFSDIVQIPNDAGAAVTVNLTGTGIVPVPPGVGLLQIKTDVLDFDLESGQTDSQSTTITNIGDGAVAITSLVLDGDSQFSQVNDCDGQNLAPGASCTVTVTFAGGTVGNFSGVISIDSNPDSTAFLVLLGSSFDDEIGGGGCSLSTGSQALNLSWMWLGLAPAFAVGMLRRRSR